MRSARHGRTRRIAAIVVAGVVVASVALVAWRLASVEQAPARMDWMGISVTVPGGIPWYLLLPVPVELNGSAWYLVPSLVVTAGDGNWSLVGGPNGTSLSVSGRGNVSLHVSAETRGFPYAAVTPQNLTRTGGELLHEGGIPCLVYVDAGGREADLDFGVVYGSSEHDLMFTTTLHVKEGDLRAGWQELWASAGLHFDR